jgi:hypothetical protein
LQETNDICDNLSVVEAKKSPLQTQKPELQSNWELAPTKFGDGAESHDSFRVLQEAKGHKNIQTATVMRHVAR